MKAVPGILPTLLEMIYFFSTPTIDVEPIKGRPAEIPVGLPFYAEAKKVSRKI